VMLLVGWCSVGLMIIAVVVVILVSTKVAVLRVMEIWVM